VARRAELADSRIPSEIAGTMPSEIAGTGLSRRAENGGRADIAYIIYVIGISIAVLVLLSWIWAHYRFRWARALNRRLREPRTPQRGAGIRYDIPTTSTPAAWLPPSPTREMSPADRVDPDNQRYLAWKVHEIDKRLRQLEERLEAVSQERNRTSREFLDQPIASQQLARPMGMTGVGHDVQQTSPGLTKGGDVRDQEIKFTPPRFSDPERVGFELLDLIEPVGRAAPLARLAELTEWLRKNHPSIRAEAIGELNRDLWLLLVLTADGNTGVVAPALDSIIGSGEVLRWFEGGRYDGTQALVRANVWSLAKAVRDATTMTWQPSVKGRINLN
jgi:hypothetical protein